MKQEATFTGLELQKLFSLSIPKDSLFSISADSREIDNSQIFLPLTGEKFDGHDFVNNIFEKGIRLSFCEKSKIEKVKSEYRKNLIVVNKTLDAYQLLANYYRKKTNPTVIAITGSSGKTTTKDLVALVLSTKFKTYKTEENFNNEFGVPKTILEMPQDIKVLVLELAMRSKGEIRYLSKTSEPDIAVITNIGYAHIGRLGTIEETVRAKCEILEHLRKEGIAVLFNDPKLIDYSSKVWKGKTIYYDLSKVVNISFKEGKSHFLYEDEEYSVNAHGKIHVLNSICTITIARLLGMTRDEINKGLNLFQVPDGRGNVIELRGGITLIDESYNANPDSLRAALSNLFDCWQDRGEIHKKILVLGELAELGEHESKLLSELNEWLKHKPINNIITVGERLNEINTKVLRVKDINECFDALKELLESKTVILVKGSHKANLKELVNLLKVKYKKNEERTNFQL